MPLNLLAVCRHGSALTVRRVKVTSDVQTLLEGIFTAQHADFWEGIDEEVEFDGGWKPDRNEVLCAASDQNARTMFQQATGNITALEEVSPSNFSSQGIRALGAVMEYHGEKRLLLQNFSSRQILDKGISLFWDGDTFQRLSASSFTLGTSISGIMNDTKITFKSFNNIKMIFDLFSLYQEASNQKIAQFGAHSSVSISDMTAFQSIADQTIRKLVSAVSAKNVFGVYSVETILAAANAQGFDLNVHDSKIVFPSDRASVKRLMHFLDEGLYKGPLSGASFITNSKKPA